MSKTAAIDKAAGGVIVFLLEELGDARLRCAQLKRYIKEATDLIEKSDERDHFFEVAAHLMHGIPDCLLRLEKALDAAALAGARIDYEEIKESLRPEKTDELEDALQEVRLRYLTRRSDEGLSDKDRKGISMTPKQAAEILTHIADETEHTGVLPLPKVMTLLARVEGRAKRASVPAPKAAAAFRAVAKDMASANPPAPSAIANWLRNVLADQITPTSAQVAATIYQQANSREEVMKGFKESNPSMTDEDLEKAADNWEKHKDVVKRQHE